jgi:(4-(4-[2-(gamma-L-glutamylamino)ethyl]phenoxymethyl)furan-2-yl)methanamine synthase
MMLRSHMAESTSAHRLAIDIGGANLKLYHSCGVAESIGFPMWLRPYELATVLTQWIGKLPQCNAWGVTMTGEMADAFSDRREGVRVIVEQTMEAARQSDVDKVGFYAIPGRMLNAEESTQSWQSVASANWHALAFWVASWIDRPSLLLDIGGTTSDIIPLLPGRVATESQTDFDRLIRGELVYLGTSRTPVCSLVTSLPFRGVQVPVMREVFANTDDCALILGWINEQVSDHETCDRLPRTKNHAAARIARMIGLDGSDLCLDEAELMAKSVMAASTELLHHAARRHEPYYHSQWIVSGHANYLLRKHQEVSIVDLADRLEPAISRVGPAYAICHLMNDRDWMAECRE